MTSRLATVMPIDRLPPSRRRPLRWLLRLLAAAGLAGVFWAYLDPHTVVDLSQRMWSCFG